MISVIHSFDSCLRFTVPDFSRVASLSLSLWVQGQDLTCGKGHWFSEGVSCLCQVYLFKVSEGILNDLFNSENRFLIGETDLLKRASRFWFTDMTILQAILD